MKVKVSKVFADFVNETAKEFGKCFHAYVRKRRVSVWSNFCDADYDWETSMQRELVVGYPIDYYAGERVVHTDELLAEFNRRGVKDWAGLQQMVIDMFEI